MPTNQATANYMEIRAAGCRSAWLRYGHGSFHAWANLHSLLLNLSVTVNTSSGWLARDSGQICQTNSRSLLSIKADMTWTIRKAAPKARQACEGNGSVAACSDYRCGMMRIHNRTGFACCRSGRGPRSIRRGTCRVMGIGMTSGL